MIIGLDSASDRWHALADDGVAQFCRIKDKDPDVRRATLCEHFDTYLGGVPINTWVFCEEPLALKNGQTTRLLGLSAGALWEVGHRRRVQWTWVDVATWKRVIVGNGNADKAQIAAWVQFRLGLQFSEPDHYDAACLLELGKLVIETGKEPTLLPRSALG